MTTNEIVGRLKAGGLDASSTNRGAAVYVTEARSGRAEPGWFGFRIICDSEATERRVRSILSRWYDIDASGNVWRLRAKNRVPLMAIKRGGTPPTPPAPPVDYMYFEAVQANSTVSMMSTLATAPDLEYSTDGVTWQEWQHTTADSVHTFDTLTLTDIGDRVYLRGDNPNGFANNIEMLLSFFSMFGKINAGGNIMSLLDKTMALTVVPDSGFLGLFGDVLGSGENPNTALLTPPDMSSITVLGDFACLMMFSFCTNLTYAANMPSLTSIGINGLLYAYTYCTSITLAADLPLVSTFGQLSIYSMYEGDTQDISVFCEFDSQTSTVTALNFEFPQLPVDIGSEGEEVLNTYTDVIKYMLNM